jgi:hypothetical protein
LPTQEACPLIGAWFRPRASQAVFHCVTHSLSEMMTLQKGSSGTEDAMRADGKTAAHH